MSQLHVPPTWNSSTRQGSPWSDCSDSFADLARHASSSMYEHSNNPGPQYWPIAPQNNLTVCSGPHMNGSSSIIPSPTQYPSPIYDGSLATSSYVYSDAYPHLLSTGIEPSMYMMSNDTHQYTYRHSPLYYPCNIDTLVTTWCEWDGCNAKLDDTSHSGMRRHFRTHHNICARGTRTRCEWGAACRSEAMLFENIPKHIAECHLKSMTIQCPTCGGLFARKDTLKRHSTTGCPGARNEHAASS